VQRAYVHNNRNNPITKKTTASGSLFFFLKNWASFFLFFFASVVLAVDTGMDPHVEGRNARKSRAAHQHISIVIAIAVHLLIHLAHCPLCWVGSIIALFTKFTAFFAFFESVCDR
jgi:hypothetical protein